MQLMQPQYSLCYIATSYICIHYYRIYTVQVYRYFAKKYVPGIIYIVNCLYIWLQCLSCLCV